MVKLMKQVPGIRLGYGLLIQTWVSTSNCHYQFAALGVTAGYDSVVTVVVGIKVWDGLVIAADSATTFNFPNGSAQVYNNANKIFHLHRKYPVSAATWGLGALGSASVSTLAKELRRRFMGADPSHEDWTLEDNYTIRGIVDRLIEMMFDELYSPQVSSGLIPVSEMGFLIAGFQQSGPAHISEMWKISISDPTTRPVPQLVAGGLQAGYEVFAIEEAAKRLFLGVDPGLQAAILGAVEPAKQGDFLQMFMNYTRNPVLAGMPFADAIRLAEFIVEVTVGYAHFLPGPDVVGGPIEIAAISRDEGFKWISRKHYYQPNLNPKDPSHDV